VLAIHIITAPATIGGPIDVLHVDDDTRFTDKVSLFVERADEHIGIETATGASEAMDRLESAAYDCVVSGYELSDGTGIEFLESVRGAYPELPFVLFPAEGSEAVASEAISRGVSDYLQRGSNSEQYELLAMRIRQLVEDYRARAQLDRHVEREERSEQYHDELLAVTTNQELDRWATTLRLLELTREFFGTENGHLVTIDREADRHRVVSVTGTNVVQEGVTDLSNTYCRRTIESDDVLDVHNAAEQGWIGDPAYERYELGCYIGKRLTVEGDLFGTVCFVSEDPRGDPFTSEDLAFFDLVSRTLTQLLERDRRQRRLGALFDDSLVPAFVIDVGADEEFCIRTVNQRYEAVTGLDADEIEGKTPRHVLGAGPGAALEARYRECVQRREPIAFEEVLPVPEAATEWQTKIVPVVEADEVVQLVGTSRVLSNQNDPRTPRAELPQ